METTYTTTVKTMNGDEIEITLSRLTMRHALKLKAIPEDDRIELLMDLVAPGVLDIIAPEGMDALVATVMEVEKDFFDRMAAMTTKKKSPSRKRKKKNA